jgi:hypothetical protein
VQCCKIFLVCRKKKKKKSEYLENSEHMVALVSSVLYHVTSPEIAEEQTASSPVPHTGYS